MAGYEGKFRLEKKLVEKYLAVSYDEYYALKVNEEVFHVYGVNKPVLIHTTENVVFMGSTED